MGRGLSEQQKKILTYIHETRGKVSVESLPSFGHERGRVKSDVERASVARAITRLVKRDLLERVKGPHYYSSTELMLTSAGSKLAKELIGKG